MHVSARVAVLQDAVAVPDEFLWQKLEEGGKVVGLSATRGSDDG